MRDAFARALPDGGWRTLPPMTTARAFFGSVVSDGAVVALGAGGAERFDPARGAWEAFALDGPIPATHFGVVAIGGTAFLVGGFPAEAGAARSVDLRTGHVALLPPLPGFAPGDHFHAVAALGGELHVVGGLCGDPPSPQRTHWVLRDGQWRRLADAPAPVWMKFGCLAVVGDDLFVFTEECALAYSASTDSWRRVAPLEPATLMPAAVVREGAVEVLGGTTMDGSPLPRRRYKPGPDRWEVMEAPGGGRGGRE